MRRHWSALLVAAGLGLAGGCGPAAAPAPDLAAEPWHVDAGLDSRSISFENPTGARGMGGRAAHRTLGVGRKGSPARLIQPGETVQLADIAGPGTIRHIWMTTRRTPENLRSLVVRVYYNGQAHPGIECPLGDLMGFAHGKVMPYHSTVHSVGQNAGMNLWLPMPFTERVRVMLSNEGDRPAPLFYQIDYTLGDRHAADAGALHVLFRRENPTTLTEDFEILPQRTGRGRYIGAVLGIRSLDTDHWWGEGEIKVYLDGDTEFPTLCGTGSEDYVGLSYGMQQTPFPLNGCSLNRNGFISMYRWHLPDPIYWRRECRITIQQIGYDREREGRLYERQDDWSTATFWYEPIPSAPLPPMPDVGARTADLGTEES